MFGIEPIIQQLQQQKGTLIVSECQEVMMQIWSHVLVKLLHRGQVADDIANKYEMSVFDRPDYGEQLASPHQLEGKP